MLMCIGCCSTWDDEELAKQKATNPRIISCCPERKMVEHDPCAYCGDGIRTDLPGNACENCMNRGFIPRAIADEQNANKGT